MHKYFLAWSDHDHPLQYKCNHHDDHSWWANMQICNHHHDHYRQTKIKYGSVGGGSTSAFFRVSSCHIFNHFAFFTVKTTKSKTIIWQSSVSFWAKSSSTSWDDWDRSNVLFYIWSVWRTGNENQTHADTTPTFLSSSYKHLKGGSGQK